ncbi:MAG: proline--tRNA ligase [Candidatus Methanoliparum thermophilum]|uniref:Proline--tRNA ligase n=1 Tax=Methanoliparum thermophilum TaxID=2491083 RepID=A0A520KU10_METT2|nr:proline--tRNA ligase [Candidatus Methanoliparum sp. LAM-1]RZN65530.1 MAG: proline--tRNA ligase [Candidatus Methanoliparum thermophilum]BDC35375.1 proline--tRNA ligase [Candidatus Methanoliparum sp. LAM-1]
MDKKGSFSEWYNDILRLARIIDVRYPVKGLYVWCPFGFKIRKYTYDILRELLDNTGHKETYFPLLIPEQEFMKEAEHIKGFQNEVYWVTKGGLDDLDVPLALRPTSETAIYPIFKLWIRSHADLPILVYQIVNTYRYETKGTKPLVRNREISSFKEAHTAHENYEDAEKQVKKAIEIYKSFFKRLCIPVMINKRPDWDKFAGADYTIAIDTIMPDGKTLQIGTIHNLKDNFARTFGITYEDKNGRQNYVNQTCYGISERCIAAMISIHGDDKGLVIPPEIAPIQIVIIPIIKKEHELQIIKKCESVYDRLKTRYRVKLDKSDERPGAKYYKWELKGVPFRIEIGLRDIEKDSVIISRRDTNEKVSIKEKDINGWIEKESKKMVYDLYNKAEREMVSRIVEYNNIEKLAVAGETRKRYVYKVSWCGKESCGEEIERMTGLKILGEIVGEKEDGRCVLCGDDSKIKVYLAKTY